MRAVLVIGLSALPTLTAVAADDDPSRGQQFFTRACAACHSLKPNANMTGPSLAGVWDRKAGTLQSFARYSAAMKSAQVVWGDKTLNAWIENPAALIPGNRMSFPGLKDAQARTDLVAYLKQKTAPEQAADAGQSGGMGESGGDAPNLRKLSPDQRVTAITHCRDTYTVSTSDGQKMDYWERNLRFKTDTSETGPVPGAPAIIGAGMAGDRASVIFAAPEEISAWIKPSC